MLRDPLGLPLGFMLKRRARHAARRAGFGLAAGITLLTGAGFLLSAAWILLEEVKGALFASAMLGLGLLGLGLVLLAVALSRSRPEPEALIEDLDEATLEELRRAATGGPGDLERALHGLLSASGLPPPATGNMPALAAAFVFGLTLALTKRRR